MNAHYSGGNLDSGVADVLRGAFGYVPPVSLMPLPRGMSARRRAFALHDAKLPPAVLLIRYPREELYEALRAFHVLQALREVSFPAAPHVFYMSWGYRDDETLLMLEYVQGRSTEGHPVAFFARTGEDFAATLAQLHRIPWPVMPELPYVSRMDILHDLGLRLQTLNAPPLDALFRRLWEWSADIEELPYCVVHGRYTLKSIVSRQTRVAAIYDWEWAVLADARLDVGYTCAHLSAHRLQMASAFMEGYMREAGPLQEMRFWNALGGLRRLTELTEALHAFPSPRDPHWQQELSAHWGNVFAFTSEQVGMALP